MIIAIYRSTYVGGIVVEIYLSMLIECNHQCGCDLDVDQYSRHGRNMQVSLCQSNRLCGLAEAKAVWFVKVPARVSREDDDGDDVDC